MYDTHVHTVFSPDATAHLTDYTKTLGGTIKGLGITEHVDFLPECGAYGFFDYKSFIRNINEVNDIGYNIHAGAEIDYAKSVEDEILKHIEDNLYEYLICSVHMVDGFSISNRSDIFKIANDKQYLRETIEKYYEQIFYSLEVEEFDVIGHINVYKRYFEPGFFDEIGLQDIIEKIEWDLAKACASSDKIIEVNTSGLFSPVNNTLPEKSFLGKLSSFGGDNVTLGSDAHVAQHVGRGFIKAQKMLKDLGFDRIEIPWEQRGK